MATQTHERAARSGAGLASLGLARGQLIKLLKAAKSGLAFSRLGDFAAETELTWEEISRTLDIPPRTLARRKAAGTLTGRESERLLRLARLFDETVELFEGDKRAALGWLREPVKGLGNIAPLELAETEVGARAVEDLIGRLEHGVYP